METIKVTFELLIDLNKAFGVRVVLAHSFSFVHLSCSVSPYIYIISIRKLVVSILDNIQAPSNDNIS